MHNDNGKELNQNLNKISLGDMKSLPLDHVLANIFVEHDVYIKVHKTTHTRKPHSDHRVLIQGLQMLSSWVLVHLVHKMP